MSSRAHAGRRVLVAVDEFHASLALVRGLRAGGFAPVLAISRDGTYAAHSNAVAEVIRVPSAEDSPEQFAASVAKHAPTLGVEAILPGTEASLLALSRIRARLAVKLGAPALETVDLVTDKPRMLAIAAACGLPQPPSTAGDPAALAARADELRFPLILKPQRTRLALSDGHLAYFKARRLDNAGDLRAALRELPDADWVVQPYIEGGLTAVSGVAWDGEIVAAVHQRSLRIWPADVGYSSYAVTTARDVVLEDRVAALLRQTGWSGIFQLQMLSSGDGTRYAIDFNPRAYGSMALAIRAGANLPAIWGALVVGDRPPSRAPRAGVHYRLETGDAKAIVAMLARGRLREAVAALRPRRATAHAICSLRDPGPVAILLRKALGKLGL